MPDRGSRYGSSVGILAAVPTHSTDGWGQEPEGPLPLRTAPCAWHPHPGLGQDQEQEVDLFTGTRSPLGSQLGHQVPPRAL